MGGGGGYNSILCTNIEWMELPFEEEGQPVNRVWSQGFFSPHLLSRSLILLKWDKGENYARSGRIVTAWSFEKDKGPVNVADYSARYPELILKAKYPQKADSKQLGGNISMTSYIKHQTSTIFLL